MRAQVLVQCLVDVEGVNEDDLRDKALKLVARSPFTHNLEIANFRILDVEFAEKRF